MHLANLIQKIAGESRKEDYPYSPRPSLAGPERCIRQLVYYCMGAPRKAFGDRFALTIDDSSFHEDLTFDWVRQSAFTVHSEQMEVSLPPPMNVGHIDAVITNEANEDVLVEHKAYNHFTFNRIADGELPLDNLTQIALYSYGIQKHLNPKCQYALLLCKNKNTAQYVDYFMRYHLGRDQLEIIESCNNAGEIKAIDRKIDLIVLDAVEKFVEVERLAEKMTLPRRPYDYDDWQCSYCPYQDACWQGYEQEFAELRTDGEFDATDLIEKHEKFKRIKSESTAAYDNVRAEIKKMMKNCDVRVARIGADHLAELKLRKDNKEVLYIKKLK